MAIQEQINKDLTKEEREEIGRLSVEISKIVGKAFVKYAVFFKRVEVFGGISGRHKARNPGMFRKIFGGLFSPWYRRHSLANARTA